MSNIENKIAPVISVVLPVYNGEKYLAEAIDSILSQTFKEFELIVIDDGSTDKTLSILNDYEIKDSRISIISRENKGLVETLNEGIDFSRGEWIARMDADDIALPHRFERQLECLKETHADICSSWVRRFGTSDKRVVRLSQTDAAIKMEMLFGSPFVHPAVIMKADLIRQLRYDKAWKHAEDYDLWERAVEVGCKVTNVPEVLLLYRMHDSQISSVASAQQHKLTQKIRRRYWSHIFDAKEIDSRAIDQIVGVYEDDRSMVDIDLIDMLLVDLLKNTEGEAREVILDHAIRIYYKVAADCPNIIARWYDLNRIVGFQVDFTSIFKLCFLHYLKIRPKDKIFTLVKRLHVFLVRKT